MSRLDIAPSANGKHATRGHVTAPTEPPRRIVPQFRSVSALAADFPSLRSSVVEGLLRTGEVMNVVAPPKAGKSWLSIDLSLSVASGRPWLGRYPTTQGNVLVLDNELHPETTAQRIPAVAEARSMRPEDYAEAIFVEHLRGRLLDIHSLADYFDQIERGRFALVVLDALYRFLPADADENSNGGMSRVFNAIDRYASLTGAAFVLVHHSTKGDQSGKAVTDVGAGAGAQSRAADSHLVLRAHETEGAVVLDAATRSWAPIDPVTLRWTFPVFDVAGDLDPAALKRPPSRGDERQSKKDQDGIAAITAALKERPLSKRGIREALGSGPDRVNRLVRMMRDGGLIASSKENVGGNQTEVFHLSG